MTQQQAKPADLRTVARELWSTGDFDTIATSASLIPAANLVRFAGIEPGNRVLDVATGSGPVAITAHRAGADVTGLDVAPPLLAKAAQHCALAGIEGIEWIEGDATRLEFDDDTFDVVLSQFGHMFAPDPEATTAEMLRVVKPGGRIAFSTWPAEHYVGQMFMMNARHMPPPAGTPSPLLWGDPKVVRERLGDAVDDIMFRRGSFSYPALSPQHYRAAFETYFGPAVRMVRALSSEPDRLEAWRREWIALASRYFHDNGVLHEYLMTRATKR